MKFTLGPTFIPILFVFVVAVPLATAGPVTVQVTGQVTESGFATIGVDSLVTGYYRYDDTTPDSHPDPENAIYEGVTFSLSFVDGSTISSDEAWIFVNNDSTGIGTYDEYAVYFPMPSGDPSPNTLTGSFAGLDVLFGARFYRNDPTGVAWDSVALPDPESVLSLLPDEESLLSLADLDAYYPAYLLRFEVTDLSVVPPVPVPGALVLAGLGLSSAGWLLRRRNASA